MQIISAGEAVTKIPDGAAVVVSGFLASAVPEYLLSAIEEAFLRSQSPRDLTLIWDSSVGDGKGGGVDHLGHAGLVKKAIACHCSMVPKLQKMIDTAEIPAYILPLGCVTQLFREIGSGRPGLISKIGLHTYVDPRLQGGKGNAATTEDIVELIKIDGEEYLFYKAFPMDVAVIRGTSVDEKGNLTCEHEVFIDDILVTARAVKRNGGIVIAQVERTVANGSLPPRSVVVPGVMIDYVVVAPTGLQEMVLGAGPVYNGAWAHEYQVKLDSLAPLELDERKIIARRAALELSDGNTINLGIGMPEGIGFVAAEEGISDRLTMTVECGHIGGIPESGIRFGCCYNPEYVVDMCRQFEWYDGGTLDVAFLGAAQVDQYGNGNVSKFGKTIGPGGFINIAHTARKVCFCGTLTAGGLKIAVEDGLLTIRSEGKAKKYMKQVEQITFSGKFAVQARQEVLYITERAVFSLTAEGVVLIEIAPGIDLQTQVLDQVDFDVKVSPDLRIMDSRIFRRENMGITF